MDVLSEVLKVRRGKRNPCRVMVPSLLVGYRKVYSVRCEADVV